jgi:hypothetical protein
MLRHSAAPAPPAIGGSLLTAGQVSFLEFLSDPECQAYCEFLFGGCGTSPSTMLQEFLRSTKTYYYGHRRSSAVNKGKFGTKGNPADPGKLNAENTATKKALKRFARRAYRGDPDRRGVQYWERVAWLLWSAYASLMALRQRAIRISQQEIKRIEHLPVKRQSRAEYMRLYRAEQRAAREAEKAREFKKEAKDEWRRRRESR